VLAPGRLTARRRRSRRSAGATSRQGFFAPNFNVRLSGMRNTLSRLAFLTTFCAAFSALGCGGGDDDLGQWALDRREYSGRYGLPFLSPANDSRLNLRLLMLDLHPDPIVHAPTQVDAEISSAPLFTRADFSIAYGPKTQADVDGDGDLSDTVFSDSEGSRCVSAANGSQAFAAAVQAEPALSPEERKALTDARAALSCEAGAADASTVVAPSPRGREFAAYLAGAAAFYRGDFDAASASFGALGKSGNAWLAETARYMAARTLLNKAQVGAFVGFDGQPEPKVTDQASLASAETELKAYVGDYPKGRYVASARGLLRRVYWLGGQQEQLAAEYSWQISHLGDAQANLDEASLAQEIDSKFLDAKLAGGHGPYLLAVEDLMRMRKDYDAKPGLTAKDLDAQAHDFAGHDDLLTYLRAAEAFYVEGDASAALDRLGPASAGSPSSPRIAFSREVLRGQALMAAGRGDEATEHWRALLASSDLPWEKEAVELGIALEYERAGTLNKAFEGETRLSSPRIRAILLRYEAGPILLREAVANPLSTEKERALARFVLLFKEATHGQSRNFLRDFTPEARKGDTTSPANAAFKSSLFAWAGSKAPYPCPALLAVMDELASDPASSHGRLCLAEFVHQSDLDGFDETHPRAHDLGSGKSIYPGADYSPSEVYKAIAANDEAPDRDRAFALYRLVNCYGPSATNHCGGKAVDLPQRKAWFQLLKTKYADTTWGKSQRIYW
jgi:hypothetical protein